MSRKQTGVRKWKGGWQAYIQVHGTSYAKSFPLSTPMDVLRDWRAEQRQRYRLTGPARGSFRADIQTYLARVTAMASYDQRVAHLELWAEALGRDRPRRTVTPGDIDQVLQGWLLAGLAPGTVRKRRTALLSLWHKLDGRHAPNPVRASMAPREPKPEARGLSYDVIGRILDAMPPSLTKLRVTVMAWTGLPPKILSQIDPGDLNLPDQTVRVRPRRKGAGVPARTLPLLPQAVTAFRAFDQGQAYGPFSVPSANQCFRRACRRTVPQVADVSLYDLRHSFGTMLYRVTKDLATVSRFLLHANIAMSQRYAQGAMQDVDREAAALAGRIMSSGPVLVSKTR